MTRRTISAYTPSNTDPELLKRIFVQRHRLLEKLVGRLARSMTSGDKHHTVLIGPRGCGKTHLVSLAAHELQNRPGLRNSMRIAWLGEDDTIAGLVDLAFAIAGELARAYPDEFPDDFREPVRGLSPDRAAESVLNAVIERLGEHNIVLLMENMDRAFNGLGELGREKWRAFLQENRRIAILGTSQQLFKGISIRSEVFFGFFDIQHLKQLTVDDAQELMLKISAEQGKDDLSRFLRSPEGRYRVRALHHLAGGNHRLYVMLSEFLTKDSLNDLVEAFERLAEELTPYFQERLRSLAPQQAKLVECLCNATGAMTVKEIAEETFVAERNCSKQLGELKRKGYALSQKQGKESFYELAEPMMRLSLEVKQQRGLPLKLVVQFLRAWFPDEELRKGSPDEALSTRGEQYRESAINSQKGFDIPIAAELGREIDAQLSGDRYDEASELTAELRHIDPYGAYVANAKIAVRKGDHGAAILALSGAIGVEDATAEQRAQALFNRGVAHRLQGDLERELSDYTAVVEMKDATAEQRAMALVNRGNANGLRGDLQRELDDYAAVVKMEDVTPEPRTRALFGRGLAHARQGDVEGQLSDYTEVVKMQDATAEQRASAFFNRGLTHGQRSDVKQALSDYTAVVKMADAPAEMRAQALVNRGNLHGQRSDVKQALSDYTAVVEMADAPAEQRAKALFNRGATYRQMGDVELELSEYTAVVEMAEAPAAQKAQALVNRGVTYRQMGDVERELSDYTAVVEMADAQAEARAQALFNRGLAYGQRGDGERELLDYTTLGEMEDAPAELRVEALSNKGIDLQLAERYQESHEAFEAALSVRGALAEVRTTALFILPETMVITSSREAMIEALGTAFREGARSMAAYGKTPYNLLSMVLRRGHQEWRAYIADLAPLYIQNDAAERLGQGIFRTIEVLDAGGYSETQLDKWNSAWQEVWTNCEDSEWRQGLALPLLSLNAAIEAIKTKSDRPLLGLPLEVRELIRPLLSASLGK